MPERSDPSATAKLATRTGADGSFVLSGTRRDRGLRFVVIADGHARHAREIAAEDLASGDLDLGDIRLQEERALAGVVVEADGTPVIRTVVYLSKPKQRGAHRWLPSWYGFGDERFTDDLGRFRFRGLMPGPYRVYTRPAGRSQQMLSVEVPKGRDVEDARLVLPGVRRVLVRVETVDGAPVAGMGVSGMTEGSVAVGVRGTTGRDGTVTLNVSPDVVALSLSWSRAMQGRYVETESGWRKLEPDMDEVRYVLREAVITAGRIQNEQGQPVPGLHVRVAGMEHIMTSADKDGRFRLPTPKGPPVDLVVDGWAQREVGGGAIQGYQSEYGGRLYRVTPGARDVVLHVEKVEKK